MTIPDTVVWSLFLRRKKPSQKIQGIFVDLIENGQIGLFGIIKQELLSGVKTSGHFDSLTGTLSAFPTILASETDHIMAGRLFNLCRSRGIQGSHIDFLILAMSISNQCTVLTTDKDFGHYQKIIDFDLLIVSP